MVWCIFPFPTIQFVDINSFSYLTYETCMYVFAFFFLFFHKIPFFIFFFHQVEYVLCAGCLFHQLDLIYMLIMVFKINCISSMKTNRLILTKMLFTFWKICFPICVDPTGSSETKIWASKTMIMNITPQRMETEN